MLGKKLNRIDGVVRAKKPERLPVVLTTDEVQAILQRLAGTERLVALLLYGAGLRLLEALRLRVKDIDFAMNQVTVRDGKGQKDRVTMLPAVAKPLLAAHLTQVKGGTPKTSRPASAASTCPSRWRKNIPTPTESGGGNTSFQRAVSRPIRGAA